ncbi:MAG: hypothetical protein ACOZIN_09425 [Myxococcota bacterium]
MRPTGKVNLVSLLLIAGVVGGIYALVVFSPVYLDNLDVKEAIAAAYNQAGRMDDRALVGLIKSRVNAAAVGEHVEDDGYGNQRVVGGLGIKDEQITVQRDEVRRTILIRVDYQREVVLKPTDRIRQVRFSPMKEGPIPP